MISEEDKQKKNLELAPAMPCNVLAGGARSPFARFGGRFFSVAFLYSVFVLRVSDGFHLWIGA